MSLLDETRLTLNQLARLQNVNPATCWRWATKGTRGVVLETIVLGGRRVTTKEAFARFVEAVTSAADSALSVRSPAAGKRDTRKAAEASAKLAAMGF